MQNSNIKKYASHVISFTNDKLQKYGLINSLSTKSFLKWWNDFKLSNSIPEELITMVDYYVTSPSFAKTSKYWNFLCKKHIELLNEYGIENFKQTIERFHYWGEANIDSVLIKPLLDDQVTVDVKVGEIYRYYEFCSKLDSIQHNLANIILLNYIVNNGYGNYLEILEEPTFGNPIYIEYNQRRVSFSLLNSIIEIDVLIKNLDLKQKTRFMEIGAGSGRTASALLSMLPDSKYIIVDIPPALFISQESLTRNFTDKKIFKFREIADHEEIREEFNAADIIFLSPEQMKFIPDKYVDIAIAIDCLHEMTTEDVEKYFENFNRIADYFYFKCQIVQWAKTSNILYTIDSYPIKSHWTKLLHEKCFIPNDYFHAIYRM